MSDDLNSKSTPIGFLLLRDGHAVPLSGVSPDDVKDGAKHRIPNPEVEPLRYRQTLNAIIDRLGFRGDFGDYSNRGWPDFLAFLRKNGCADPARLFPSDHGGCIDLYFRPAFGPTRRQLADRVFESHGPAPERVFLGNGVDWAAWDHGMGIEPPEEVVPTIGGDPATAEARARKLFACRHALSGQWGFLDDKLVWGPVQQVVDKTYWVSAGERERQASHDKVVEAVRAFRAVFDTRPEGWVDLVRYNERLVVLRAHDGAWDVLWRSYREEDPPEPSDIAQWTHLAIEDLPASMMSESDLQRSIHFRQEVWEEREAHEAEQAFYDRGGTAQDRQLTPDAEVRTAWLREQGRLPAGERVRWTGELPPGFRVVEVGGRRMAISELVDLGTFRRMLVDTGYLRRRPDGNEPWERANEGAHAGAPVGGSWADAQAFCAWKERQLGVAVRLPTKNELRAIRPFFSERYASLAGADFLWENFPPRPLVERADGGADLRRDLPSAVNWSEPRFLEPGPDLPEFPEPSGLSSKSRKRWIEDFPPFASWREELPWASYAGLGFIDAWDAYEWCQEVGWVHGRFWEGRIGLASWGAYKNMKVTFRLVLDLEG